MAAKVAVSALILMVLIQVMRMLTVVLGLILLLHIHLQLEVLVPGAIEEGMVLPVAGMVVHVVWVARW